MTKPDPTARRLHARTLATTATVTLVLLVFVLQSSMASASIAPPSPNIGATSNRHIPAAIRELPLTNQANQPVNLASWPGKTLLLVPFLTLCSDVCPLTTGDLFQAQQFLNHDKNGSKVQIVEFSVDPNRDDPARLAAYAKLTGATWQLVT
jgi:cytochrome oxidase Cu insertion factor (SCO1/SenC/PrrC family)